MTTLIRSLIAIAFAIASGVASAETVMVPMRDSVKLAHNIVYMDELHPSALVLPVRADQVAEAH